MIYLTARSGREILSCNTNYIQEGIRHPDRILDEYDFLYIKNGTWDIWENDACYPVKERQMLILEPGKHHYSLDVCSSGMRNMYLHCTRLPEDVLSSESGNTADCFFLQKITDCSGNLQIERLMLHLIETYWSKEARHRKQLLESLFFLLLAELERCAGTCASRDPVVTEMIHQFYLRPDRFFSPQELADTYHISVRSLSSRFKKSTGTSIHRYQMDLKLDLANEQIPLYPDRRIKEIALDLGFYDEFQFSRLFKRRFGYPPSRRQ